MALRESQAGIGHIVDRQRRRVELRVHNAFQAIDRTEAANATSRTLRGHVRNLIEIIRRPAFVILRAAPFRIRECALAEGVQPESGKSADGVGPTGNSKAG